MSARDVPVSVLAGDIGGTHTRLARAAVAGRNVEILAQETLSQPGLRRTG